MASYATRTCHCCGIKQPQPHMYQVTAYVEAGRSKASVSTSTFVGSMLGDKKSGRAINSWLFNTNQRNYQRKRTVWACSDCKGRVGQTNWTFFEVVKAIFFIAVLLWLIAVFGASPS